MKQVIVRKKATIQAILEGKTMARSAPPLIQSFQNNGFAPNVDKPQPKTMMGHRTGTDAEKIPCPVPFPCPNMFAFFALIQFLMVLP
jgi:hypothetical protein